MEKKMEVDRSEIIKVLNEILEHELAGVVRYTHYSLMVFGYNRIPIVKWLRDQAHGSLTHAEQVGEWITTFKGHPSLKISGLLETEKHKIDDILNESLQHERRGIELYYKLLPLVENKLVGIEEFTRESIAEEEMHLSEVEKMLRAPK